MNDDSIATHMHCHVLSVLLTGPKKKKKKKKKRRFKIFKCESVLSFLYVLIYFYFPYAEVQLQKVAFTHVYFGPDIVSLIKQKFHTGSMLLLKYNFEYFLEGALESNYGI